MQSQNIGIIDEGQAVVPCVRDVPIRGYLCEKPVQIHKKASHIYALNNSNRLTWHQSTETDNLNTFLPVKKLIL